MNALADKVHKQEVPYTQWYALHTMTTLMLLNNHPYIVAVNLVPTGMALQATYMYVGMVEGSVICTLGQTNVCTWKIHLHLPH